MPHHHLYSVSAAQTFRQLLREINRAMLAACATERHRQACKAMTLIIAHAHLHQRHHAGHKPMHAFLLIEIIDHRSVFARKSLESLLASRIRYAAGIKNESTAMPRLVSWYTPVK